MQHPTVRGYFVGQNETESPPVITSIPSVSWVTDTAEKQTIWRALECDLLTSTNAAIVAEWQSRFGSQSPTTPSRVILKLETNDTHNAARTNQRRLENAIARQLPTRSLGTLSAKVCAILDHLHFQATQSTFMDRLLLAASDDQDAIRKRFRTWSTLIHPDRFASRPATEALLVDRINHVYAILGETYRSLTDPYRFAIHQYWLSRGQIRKAIDLDQSGAIGQMNLIHPNQGVRAQLIDVMRLKSHGNWVEADAVLSGLAVQHPQNPRLQSLAKAIGQTRRLLDIQ